MKHNLIYILLLSLVMILLAGCPQPRDRAALETPDCPGKINITEAVQALALQRQNIKSFRSRADCIVYFRDNKGGLKPETVNAVTIVFVPPFNVYFDGDKFGEIRLGTNETEFWLRVKPEMDTYWFGSKDRAADCVTDLPVNPDAIAEAFGMVEITKKWTLFYRDGYDLLDYAENGKKKKRVYVNACTYLISRIEYFNDFGGLIMSADLRDYTTGENGIVVPSNIYVVNYDELGLESQSMEITLNHVAPFTPSEKQLQKLFARPDRDGYEHYLELNENCKFEPVDE